MLYSVWRRASCRQRPPTAAAAAAAASHVLFCSGASAAPALAGVVMRVRECEWPPELVVQWLCCELDARGIPGALYAHTLLSLLHPHYCPHCHPNTSYPAVKKPSVTAPLASATGRKCAANRHLGLDGTSFIKPSLLLGCDSSHEEHRCSGKAHDLLAENLKVDRDCLCLEKILTEEDKRFVDAQSLASKNTSEQAGGKNSEWNLVTKKNNSGAPFKAVGATTHLHHLVGCSPATTPELLLEEEEELLFGHGLHPDADLPLAPHPRTPKKNQPSHNKESCCCNAVSRRSRKRHKKNSEEQQHQHLSVDHSHLHSALYLLASAADQDCEDVPELLYALCGWLEELQSDDNEQRIRAKKGVAPPPGPPVDSAASKDRCSDCGSVDRSIHPTTAGGGGHTDENARRYFKVFPALSRDSERAVNQGRSDAVWYTTKENIASDLSRSPPSVDTAVSSASLSTLASNDLNSVDSPVPSSISLESSVENASTSQPETVSVSEIAPESCEDNADNSNFFSDSQNVTRAPQENETPLAVLFFNDETLTETPVNLSKSSEIDSCVDASNSQLHLAGYVKPERFFEPTFVNLEKEDLLHTDASNLPKSVTGETSHSNHLDATVIGASASFKAAEQHVDSLESITASSCGENLTQLASLDLSNGSNVGFTEEHNVALLHQSFLGTKFPEIRPVEAAPFEASCNDENGDGWERKDSEIAVPSTCTNYPSDCFTSVTTFGQPQTIVSNLPLSTNSQTFKLFSSPVKDVAFDFQRMGSVEFVNNSGAANLTDESKLADLVHFLGSEVLERKAETVQHSTLQDRQDTPIQSSTQLIDRWSALWGKPSNSNENPTSKINWPTGSDSTVDINLSTPSPENLLGLPLPGTCSFENSTVFSHSNTGASGGNLATGSSYTSQETSPKVLPYTDAILSEVKEKLEVLNVLDCLSKKYVSYCVAYTGTALSNISATNCNTKTLPIFVHGCGMETGDSMPSATQPVVVGHAPALVIGDFTVFMPVHSPQNSAVNCTSDGRLLPGVSDKLNSKNFSSATANTEKEIGKNYFPTVSYSCQQSCVDNESSFGVPTPKLPLDEFCSALRPSDATIGENPVSSRESSEDRADFDGSLADDEDETYHQSRKSHQPQLEIVCSNNQNAAMAELNNKTLALMEMQTQMLKAHDAIPTKSSEWEWQNQRRTLEQEQRAMMEAAQDYSRCKPNENLLDKPNANLTCNPRDDVVHEKFPGVPNVSPNYGQCIDGSHGNLQELHSSVADTLQKNFERNYFIPIGPSQSLAYQTGPGEHNNEYSSVSSRSDVLDQIVPSPEIDEAWRCLRDSYPNPFHGRNGARVDVPVEKNIWADLNANNIPSSCVSSAGESISRNTVENVSHASVQSLSTDEEQNLCRTFQSLGLEKIWDSSPQVTDDESKMRQQMLLASSLLQQQQNSITMWTPDLQQQQQQKCSQSSSFISTEPAPLPTVSVVNPTILPPDDMITDDMNRSTMGLFMTASSSASTSLTDQDQLPVAGPSGMQAVLSRSSHSNFSSVVPRRTNVQEAADYLKASALSSDPYRSRATENLLTSPRTHFRPIKSQEEQTTTNSSTLTFTTTATQVQLDLPYQRSNSGTLFLEKDAMEGSPKKYMIYKEPIEKTWEQTQNSFTSQEASLVPKFKVVKNEKFCQTEDLGNDNWSMKPSSESTPLLDSDDDNDVFAFQEEDALSSSVYQWNKQDTVTATSAYWRDTPQSGSAGPRSWVSDSVKFGIVDGGKILPTDFIVDKLNNVAINWSEGSPNRIVFRRRSSKPHIKDQSISPDKQERVIDTPAARAIWSSDPRTSVTASTQRYHQAAIALQNIDPAIKALWSNSPDKAKLASGTTESPEGCNTWRKSQGYLCRENAEALTGSSRLPAWTMKGQNGENEIEKQIPAEWTGEMSLEINEQESQGSGNPLTPLPYSNSSSWNTNAEGISLIAGDGNNRNVNKQKIWSTDTAGAVQWSSNDGVPNSVWSSADGSVPWSKAESDVFWKRGTVSERDWSNGGGGMWNEEEILKARWARKEEQNSETMWSTAAEVDDLALLEEAKQWEKDVSMNMGPDPKQEDLDELDPGWQFQEGFVWAQQCGKTALLSTRDPGGVDCEDFDDTASLSSCSSSSSSSEVVMMPTEDGGTLAVQVEYLDEELYDKIFGAPDLQMAGSLPDLPNNQAGLKVLRERWLPPWRRPCTFFMEGTCRRKHCKFSHDLSTITCRFWQEGSCFKGSECPFLHGYPVVTRRRNRSEGDSRGGDHNNHRSNNSGLRKESKHRPHRLSSFELSSETDFPSLGSTADAKESERCERPSAAPTAATHSTSQQQSQQKRKSKYTPITAAILQSSSSSGRSRRRRHTHSAQRSSSPESKGEASCSRSIGSTVITAGSSVPQRRENYSASKDTMSTNSAEQNGNSAPSAVPPSTSASRKTTGKSALTGSEGSFESNKASKHRHRRHRTKAAPVATGHKDSRDDFSSDD
ncbi:Zinc finger CCCH-type [Trinorchestia longiramus]|nr:Zinc finger CCCH-type [Trinorchestia longiramus]